MYIHWGYTLNYQPLTYPFRSLYGTLKYILIVSYLEKSVENRTNFKCKICSFSSHDEKEDKFSTTGSGEDKISPTSEAEVKSWHDKISQHIVDVHFKAFSILKAKLPYINFINLIANKGLKGWNCY